MFFQKDMKPVPITWIVRGLLVVIVLLALTAGYFYTENQRLIKEMNSTKAKSVIGQPIYNSAGRTNIIEPPFVPERK